MSSDQYHEIQTLICEKQIKSLIDIRQRFRQFIKENLNTIWYSYVQEYFRKDCERIDMPLIECICDLITINPLLSNDKHDDFLLVLKTEKTLQINDKFDIEMKRIYFKRRYRALINSREILFNDLCQSTSDDDRLMKLRAICVLDEELFILQQDFTFKSFSEQTAIRLQQIRAMINVYFKQTSNQFSFEHSSNSIYQPFIHTCDSFLSTFRLFLNSTMSDINLSDIQNE